MGEKINNIFKLLKRTVLSNKPVVMKILATLIIAIAILVVTSCIIGSKDEKLSGNSFNLGLAMQDGNWIYYVALDENEPVGINRVKENGKKVENVFDGNVSYLNIVDDYIYCLKYNEDKEVSNLIRVKTNGKNEKTLARNIDEAPIIATDKYVFYYKDKNLYRTKLDGTDKIKVSSEDITHYQIVGNWIYYIYEGEESGYIARMKLDGKGNERITKLASEDGTYQNIYVDGNKIYYIMSRVNNNYDTNYYLYKMNKKGENLEQICKLDSDVRYINMQEDKIYYTVSEDYETYSIYSIDYDGTDKEKIKKVNSVLGLNITEEWIVFQGVNEEYNQIMRMISLDGEKEKQL